MREFMFTFGSIYNVLNLIQGRPSVEKKKTINELHNIYRFQERLKLLSGLVKIILLRVLLQFRQW